MVRYEDLAADPGPTLARVLRAVGEGHLPVRAMGGSTELVPGHSIAGNPFRFRSGSVDIQADDEWRAAMPAKSKAIVAAITWPLRRRYDRARTASASSYDSAP